MKIYYFSNIILLLSVQNILLSQTSLNLIEYSNGIPTMNNEISTKYSKLIYLYGQENINFIEINSLSSTLDSGRLLISIPSLSNSSILFETEFVRYTNEQDFEWFGTIPLSDTSNDFTGFMILISSGNGKYGQINIDSNEYIIDFLGNDITTITHSNDSLFGNDCMVDSLFYFQNIVHLENRTTPNCKTRILILYTQAADELFPDIEQRARTAFELTTQALRNSKIDEFLLTIELAGIIMLPDFTENDENISQIVVRLSDDVTVEELRSQNSADIVSLLSAPNFGNVGTFSGAALGAHFSNNGFEYTAVRADQTNRNYVFTHEIGHCFTAGHETCDTDESGPTCFPVDFGILGFEHAHTWTWRKWFLGALTRSNTLMFTGTTGNRVLNYSNPKVYLNKGYTGISNVRDNAKAMEFWGCTISALDNGDVDELYGVILGPAQACFCGTTTLSANVQGGNAGLYSYQWSYSYDGINYISITGNYYIVTVNLPCSIGPRPPGFPKGVYVKLIITDSGNNVYTAYKFVLGSDYNEDGIPCEIEHPEYSSPKNTYSDINKDQQILHSNLFDSYSLESNSNGSEWKIELNPNPAMDEIELKIFAGISDYVTIKLFDINGQELRSNSCFIVNGLNVIRNPCQNLQSGIYIIKIDSKVLGRTTIDKLIIN